MSLEVVCDNCGARAGAYESYDCVEIPGNWHWVGKSEHACPKCGPANVN